MTNNFKLHIIGELGTTVLPSEIKAQNSPFFKAWQNFCRELDTAGVKITSGNIDVDGKNVSLPLVAERATA